MNLKIKDNIISAVGNDLSFELDIDKGISPDISICYDKVTLFNSCFATYNYLKTNDKSFDSKKFAIVCGVLDDACRFNFSVGFLLVSNIVETCLILGYLYLKHKVNVMLPSSEPFNISFINTIMSKNYVEAPAITRFKNLFSLHNTPNLSNFRVFYQGRGVLDVEGQTFNGGVIEVPIYMNFLHPLGYDGLSNNFIFYLEKLNDKGTALKYNNIDILELATSKFNVNDKLDYFYQFIFNDYYQAIINKFPDFKFSNINNINVGDFIEGATANDVSTLIYNSVNSVIKLCAELYDSLNYKIDNNTYPFSFVIFVYYLVKTFILTGENPMFKSNWGDNINDILLRNCDFVISDVFTIVKKNMS